ncbi:tRNA (5-methylaminomethyl-2-thiouridine)(34)-methyltransferase MnmD [Pseudogemmobacter sp. W21_MBD1_M6]|uniref:tRNA (5-methylaminomethyl-2-thiouridine)(34)-methyltransferase MnmD n=1 Tax=Pseudogemmobacter sp. W21_MBD1_M6 TaxID=3240271 RepID=UPI003F963BAB
MTTGQRAEIDWRDGTLPVSTRFDDPYFSAHNGLEETRHVFLAGNGLPDRFRAGFHIAELGFGTGLNLFTALIAWRQAGHTTPLHFTSFEAYPMDAADMDRALLSFPEAHAVAAPFLAAWARGETTVTTPDLHAQIIIGDARRTLRDWKGAADAWFLDGFSPAKNPELWDGALMSQVAEHTAPHGTFATYTAAGFVRRALQDAGFAVTREAGYGRKRHMSLGRLDH